MNTKEIIMWHLDASGPADVAEIEAYLTEQGHPELMALALVELIQEGRIVLDDDGVFESTYKE